ncbi:hypothetical protein AGMMS49974_05550 [Deltaproteobacteria bacterium]|nr:hypothetical protein AGMMS49974_05550 [Deltaproteobacteria bacterium]
MARCNEQKSYIQQLITTSLRNKFKDYNPEPALMPFHFRLLGKDKMALYSFIHSNFGTSIFEPVAKFLASLNFVKAETQQTAGSQISNEAQRVIQSIMDDLSRAATTPTQNQRNKRY